MSIKLSSSRRLPFRKRAVTQAFRYFRNSCHIQSIPRSFLPRIMCSEKGVAVFPLTHAHVHVHQQRAGRPKNILFVLLSNLKLSISEFNVGILTKATPLSRIVRSGG